MSKYALPANAKGMPTRRAFLRGTALAVVAGAIPVAAAAITVSILPDLIAADEAAAIAYEVADKAAYAADERFEAALKAADLRVRLNGRYGPPHTLMVNQESPPEWVRSQIDEHFDRIIPCAVRRMETDHPLRFALSTPAELQTLRASVTAEAETAFAAFAALEAVSGVDAAREAAFEATTACRAARRALFDYHPQTREECAMLAAAFLQQAERTGRWYELPVRELLASFAGEV